jgi:hypothetical protein
MMARRDMFLGYKEAVLKERQVQHETGIVNKTTVF